MQFPTLHSVEEFVAWEDGEEEKYEFSEGVISPFPLAPRYVTRSS